MDNIVSAAIRSARFTWLLIFTACAAGTVIFLTQPRQEDPEIVIRNAQVVTQAPGLSPERIEQLITRPLEERIKTIAEVKEIKSVSMTGISIITPTVEDQFTDMTPIWANLRNKMDDARGQLPDVASDPQVNDDYGRVSVITLALTGDDFSLAELYSEAKNVRDAMSALPLVARVDLHGVQSERIWIEFDPVFLAQFDIDPAQVIQTLQSQNVVQPGGTVTAGGSNYVIEPSGDLTSLDEIRSIAIKTESDQFVYVEDIAAIRRGYVDPPNAPAFYNGKPAIILGISMVAKSNVVELGVQVRDELTRLNGEVPVGMDLEVAIFQPDIVAKSVASATTNLSQTIGVVLIVVMLALGFRTGLIVGAMVPLTMMLTLIGMSIMGIELHRISIAAIIVALGLLVDNGVVIAEDIKKRLDHGTERMDAVRATAKSLAVPLLTSSLTTVAAFMPLALISGGSGEFLRSLGQVLAVALLSSWLIAIVIIPAFCYWFMPAGAVAKGGATEDHYDSAGYSLYRKLLKVVLRGRLVFIALMFALLVSSAMIFGFIKQRSLGPSERNQFTVYVDLPAEAAITETIAATEQLEDYLLDKSENPEVTDVLAYVGSGGPRFFLALSPNDAQPNKAFLVVNTETPDQIGAVMERIDSYFITDMPFANGRTDILFLGSSPLGTVEYEIAGPEIQTLRQLKADVRDAFLSVDGVRSVRDNWENAVLKIKADIDQDRARRSGVTSEDVASTLTAYFDGQPVTTFRDGELSIPVVIRSTAGNRRDLDRMRTVEVRSSISGSPVPLIQVADFNGAIEPSRIRRVDQRRTISVMGKHPRMTAVELNALMAPAIAEIDLPDGYELSLAGEIADAEESNEKLFKYAPHAFFIVILLLVLQFNSFRRPLIILSTIPLVLIGANYGLFVFKGYFDFTAMLGLFSLAGIIINNGIVLIDKIDQGRADGLGVDDAVVGAALARARPIVMTTITTIVGLVPMALFGGEFWYGMAIVIMCGIGVGTILTLGFVPVMYSLLFNLRGKNRVTRYA